MSKKILINASHQEENRVAIVEDGILSELDIEVEGREQTRGNIYKATVVRVESGLQAAFVDYGADRMGFLQIGEIHPDLFPKDYREGGPRPRINDILRRGQELLVQITREERDSKGAALTTNLSLAGRYMVLMPGSTTKGISRKIENEAQRKEIKSAMSSIDIPDNTGYIVRTAGIGQSIDELHRDFKYLYGIYTKIRDLADACKAPKLIYQESNLVIRSIRDYFTPDMDEVLIDDPEVFREAQDFFRSVMPDYLPLLKRHQERRPIFSRYQIEEQIETISQNKVQLPSGGSIVIDRTEALVAIDVNSGKMASEQGIEATAFKTNLEAAAEVGRQLRLRDLGGLIVVDFIDMRDRKHNRDVEKALKDALKSDKARVSVGRISQFGLLEMSRQRIRAALAEGSYLTCPHCSGSGRIKSTEAQAVAFLRRIHTSCAKGAVEKIDAVVPENVADYLLNVKRGELVELENALKLTLDIKGRSDFIAGQVELEIHKRVKSVRDVKTVEPITATDERPELTDEDRRPKEVKEPVGEKSKRKRRRKSAADRKAEAEAEAAVAEEYGEQPETEEAESAPEPVAETEPAETAPDASAEKSGKPKRRRRRKSAAERKAIKEAAEAAAAGLPAVETGESDEPESVGVPASEPATVAAVSETTPEASVDAGKSDKPKRRRRRKTAAEKKAEMDAAAATATASGSAADTEPAPAPLTETTVAEAPADTAAGDKPKRRRRRKTTVEKKAETEVTGSQAKEEPTQPAAPAESPAAPAPPEAADQPATEGKKPRRPRKTAAAKKTETEASNTTPAVPESAAAPDTPADTAEAKPKRRSTKKAPTTTEEA